METSFKNFLGNAQVKPAGTDNGAGGASGAATTTQQTGTDDGNAGGQGAAGAQSAAVATAATTAEPGTGAPKPDETPADPFANLTREQLLELNKKHGIEVAPEKLTEDERKKNDALTKLEKQRFAVEALNMDPTVFDRAAEVEKMTNTQLVLSDFKEKNAGKNWDDATMQRKFNERYKLGDAYQADDFAQDRADAEADLNAKAERLRNAAKAPLSTLDERYNAAVELRDRGNRIDAATDKFLSALGDTIEIQIDKDEKFQYKIDPSFMPEFVKEMKDGVRQLLLKNPKAELNMLGYARDVVLSMRQADIMKSYAKEVASRATKESETEVKNPLVDTKPTNTTAPVDNIKKGWDQTNEWFKERGKSAGMMQTRV